MKKIEQLNNTNQSFHDENASFDQIISNLKIITAQQKDQMEVIQGSIGNHLAISESIQSLTEVNGFRNKALNELISVNKDSNLILSNIAEPNIADWIGAISNIILALLGAYAAFKVKSVFDDRSDSKVHAEIERFWKFCDEITQDIHLYFLLFPFKLTEPEEEWKDNDDVKQKVESFLDFSEKQSEKMKNFLNLIRDLSRNLNRLGWKINSKSANDFSGLYSSVEKIYRSFGEYNCMTAQLFRIDRQYIGTTMFMGIENMEWEQRFELVSRNLPGNIQAIQELKDEIMNHIKALENFSAQNKFVSKR